MSSRHMSLRQIRNAVEALKRKFAPELAIIRLSRVANEITQLWHIAIANKQPKPEPYSCVRKVADAGFRLHTYMAFEKYLQRCIDDDRRPGIRGIITTLLPWTANGSWLNNLERNIPGTA